LEALWEDNKLWCPKCKRESGLANGGVVKSEMSAASLDALARIHSNDSKQSPQPTTLTTSKSYNDDDASVITFSFDDDSAVVNPIQAEEDRVRLEQQQSARRTAAAKELEEEEAAAARATAAANGTPISPVPTKSTSTVTSPVTPSGSPPPSGGETNLQRQRRLLAERAETEARERQAASAAALRADQAASLSAKSVAKEQMAAREKEQRGMFPAPYLPTHASPQSYLSYV
jgi:hypothetical protein